jgi:methionyl aminopeptidase
MSRRGTVQLVGEDEVAKMAAAGRIVALALAAVREGARVGSTLRDLDDIARTTIQVQGGQPLFFDYHPGWAPYPFPGVICASVNDAVVHGPPTHQVLHDGDVVSIDCGARYEGWCGDAAITFVVGEADPADLALIDATERALAAGIAAARPGHTMGHIGAAIAGVARAEGYGMLANHGGHGIGREMHQDPFVPNEGYAGHGMRLEPGLVLALEPMLIRDGGDGYVHDDDGWTVRTRDGSRAAHAEHTIAITADGPRILTQVP